MLEFDIQFYAVFDFRVNMTLTRDFPFVTNIHGFHNQDRGNVENHAYSELLILRICILYNHHGDEKQGFVSSCFFTSLLDWFRELAHPSVSKTGIF